MGDLRVRLLAVGQGDCVIVEFPDESLAVIDCGGIPTAANVALAFLNPLLQQGRRLRFVLATHPDKDHVEGIPALVLGLAQKPELFFHCGVERRFWKGTRVGNLRYVEVARQVLGDACVRFLQAGDCLDLQVDLLRIQVLNPDPSCVTRGEVRTHHERNNVSVVLQLQFGETIVLFCGDIEHAAWAKVENRPEFCSPHAIKAPHHGAANALPPSTVLRQLKTGAWILLSTGSNVQDKPHPDVLRTLWATPARIRCTGWSSCCASSEQQRWDVPGNAVSWPLSLRQAYLLRQPQQILQVQPTDEMLCCGDNELVLDRNGNGRHSVARKWCDGAPPRDVKAV
jgi:competence protein ComEC